MGQSSPLESLKSAASTGGTVAATTALQMRRLALLATLSLVAVALGAGCNDGTSFGLGLDGDGSNGNGAKTASSDVTSTGGSCVSTTPTALDPATLPVCAPACGGAHCVPTANVPADSRASFASCGGGYCVPDALIKSGGAKPPTCTSLGGGSGVCLGLCVPQVSDNKDILPQATCAEDERCAPCADPTTGKDTGACLIGTQTQTQTTCPTDAGGSTPGNATDVPAPVDLTCPHVGPAVVEPSTLPACSAGAHCLPSRLTPADMTSKLAACTGGFCVPDKVIAAGGRFIPATCNSIGGSEGRCTSTALPSVSAQTLLPQSSCDANEKCVPCTSPVDGSDTGACKTSCDPGPARAAVTFAGCCGGVGKCVPRADIPSNMTSTLQEDGCGASLCVPTENLTTGFVPPRCSASGIFSGDYTGVCLSDCLDFGFASELSLDRGNCSGGHTCVPCFDDDGPTGAPGCNN